MQFVLPFLLVSSSSEGVLLPFLSSKCSKLRFTTSARTALSILETYSARIIICDLPIEEAQKLTQNIEDNDALVLALIPEDASLKSLETLKIHSWLIQPYSLDNLLAALKELQKKGPISSKLTSRNSLVRTV